MFYAHTKEEDRSKWQPLKTHLVNTAKLVKAICDSPALINFAETCGFLHDIGKYSTAFQNRLMGSTKPVEHSAAGAQYIVSKANGDNQKEFLAKLIAYCIAGHHTGLPDYGSPTDHVSESTLSARLKRQIEDYSAFYVEFPDYQFDFPKSLPITSTRKYGEFSIAFLVRMLYSLLVDADFLETEAFINGPKDRGDFPALPQIQKVFTQFLTGFDNPESAINIKRTELLRSCIAQAGSDQGLFSLTIPTGGGKTYTSLAFALAHAKAHKLKRIIYCIPYTSIIEQTARVFRESLKMDCILEHHSNYDWQSKNSQEDTNSEGASANTAIEKLKWASENWDIPIIVTTNVQFFESLFANRSSRCRKVHSMMNSVIIFDEAQMLPRDYLEPCMASLAELIVNYKSSVLLCTATQPPLGRFFPKALQPKELVQSPKDVYTFFKRVSVKNLGRQTDEEISRQINAAEQALCIVNTRKHAKGLFDQINEKGRYHLSTLMCPAHRSIVVDQIRKQLAEGKPCRVVSTQVMEAGIDLDFPVGFRALAGLDSIVQAAGRVNRENERNQGTLYVFEPDSVFVKHTPAYIQQTADVARIILSQYEDPISVPALTAYYQELYGIQGKNAFDKNEIMAHFEKGISDEPNFDFRTAAEKFKIIKNDTVSVIVPWDDFANREINKLRYADLQVSFLRSLQPYTVNIYPNEFNALYQTGNIEIIKERFAVLINLEKEVYHPETGLVIPDVVAGEAFFG
jgi:CRISPR-associated endonuclease/helicase Cas3